MTIVNRNSIPQSLWMLVAGLSFALMAQCVKLALTSVGVAELTLYRSLGGVLLIYPLMLARRQNLRIRHYRLHFWRSAWGVVAIMLFYWSIHLLPTSIAYALNYCAPLFFICLAAVVLHERLRPLTVAALIGSFCGVLLLIRPDATTATLTGSIAGITSGICVGCAFLMIRKLGHHGETGLRTVIFFNFHGIIGAAILLLFLSDYVGLNSENLWPVIGVLFFATIGQITLTRALHRGASGATAALHYSGVVFAMLLDATFVRVEFSLRDLIGIAMIVSCGAAAMWLARTRPKLDATS